MAFDPATFSTAFVLITFVLGVLLLFTWVLNRRVGALVWWATAFCLAASGIGLVNAVSSPPGYAILLISNGLMTMAYGALYRGCRVFNGRWGGVPISLAGLAMWALAFPAIHDWPEMRLVLMSLIAGGYAGLSAWELWRHARQRLASRILAISLLLGLAAFNIFRGVLGIAPSSAPIVNAFASRWSAEMALFLVVFVPALAFIFLSMAKEFVESGYKEAALTDPLTGVPNRRAFLHNAATLVRQVGDKPVSCLLFDLDNFKNINDSYGHDTGDNILAAFGQVLASHLPEGSFGRLGGEEFGAVLPLSTEQAVTKAEAIRRAFASAGEAVLGFQDEVTVSVGCATGVRVPVRDLLRRADSGLYRAKAEGRNSVVAA